MYLIFVELIPISLARLSKNKVYFLSNKTDFNTGIYNFINASSPLILYVFKVRLFLLPKFEPTMAPVIPKPKAPKMDAPGF